MNVNEWAHIKRGRNNRRLTFSCFWQLFTAYLLLTALNSIAIQFQQRISLFETSSSAVYRIPKLLTAHFLWECEGIVFRIQCSPNNTINSLIHFHWWVWERWNSCGFFALLWLWLRCVISVSLTYNFTDWPFPYFFIVHLYKNEFTRARITNGNWQRPWHHFYFGQISIQLQCNYTKMTRK